MTKLRLDQSAGKQGWFIDQSNQDFVLLDENDNEIIRIANTSGNVTVPGTLAVTGATSLTGALSGASLSLTGDAGSSLGVGAVAAEGTLVSESGVGKLHVTELTFTKTTTIAGAALADGARCYTFPAKRVSILALQIDATLTAPVDTTTPEIGAGTLIGSGANATLGAVGATAEDLIEGTASEAFASSGTAASRSGTIAKLPLTVAASSVLHVNWAGSYAESEDVTVNGSVYCVWAEVG